MNTIRSKIVAVVKKTKENKYFRFLEKFVRRFFQHNTRYRIFVLFLFGLYNISSYHDEGFWAGFVFSFFLTIFETLILVYILDKQFNREIKLLIKRYNDKHKKEEEKAKKESAEIWKFIKFFIKGSFYFTVAVIVSFLTRFPFFSDFYRDKFVHYDYRHIRKLRDYLEKSCKGVYVKSVDIDKYYYILYLVSRRSITAQKEQDSITEVLKKYFDKDIQNIMIRPEGRSVQLLIPIDYLPGKGNLGEEIGD